MDLESGQPCSPVPEAPRAQHEGGVSLHALRWFLQENLSVKPCPAVNFEAGMGNLQAGDAAPQLKP